MRECLALLRQQRFAEVVTRSAPVLEAHPTYVPLRLLMCQALIGLKRYAETEAHLRYCLDLDPDCGTAYRYLGELELRRDRPDAAARLLDEACRRCRDDAEVRALLATVERRLRRDTGTPVQAPASSGEASRGTGTPKAPASAGGTSQGSAREGSGPSASARHRPQAEAARESGAFRRQLARGTDSPGPGSSRPHTTRDDFGDYLAEIGVLSRAQVRAAMIYQRTRGVDLAEAAVALGFISEPKVRWASRAYYESRRGGA